MRNIDTARDCRGAQQFFLPSVPACAARETCAQRESAVAWRAPKNIRAQK
jgi:hypothetical protein